ncbi:Exopolysaccharide biosynthesis protein [Erythrobacter dokdonensis DSW-74]|uniref:non-specific protein-tyrosine kinase n=2 Tax=Erythrobacter TaxID=1041 RepID=A0A1A7BFF2_9SPHN|nr:Exopolysaccharide biosynthesis protein [Erythrobacter dokdonensis DSW-74]
MPDGPLGQIGPAGPRAQLFNFATIRGIIYRQRWIVASTIVLALLGGLIVTLLSTPVYEASAKVAIKPFGTAVVEGQEVMQGYSPIQIYDYIATQTEVIKSRSMAETVAADLDLASRTDFIGENIEESRASGMSDEQWRERKMQIAASMLTSGVVADRSSQSWVITVGFRSTNPVLAAEIADAYADAFVATGSRDSIESNKFALEYIKGQIEETRTRLAEAEQVANSYARSSGIILQAGGTEEGSGSSTLTAANLTSINSRVASARAARIEAEQRWRAIQNLPAAELPEVQASGVLQGLVAERTTKLAQLAELRQRYNDDFPQIQNLLAQLQVIDAQVERSGDDIKASARSQFLVAQSQERALEAELASLTGNRLVEQDQQIELSVLEREAQALRDQLKSLLDRYNQVNSAANLDPGTISKIDSARVPRSPFSPNIPKNMGLAFVLGLAVAAALAVVRETLDDRVRSLDEIEEKLGLPLLGHTPHVEGRDLDALGTNRFSALMEAYSSIRAAIDFSMPRNRNVFQLTSSQASEGKSTTAVILAELFASLGRRTLLIDADLRRPSVASLLDIERPKIGLVEVLLGHVELEAAVVKGVHENLEILPVGEIPPNPAELLASRELRDFIEKYRSEYSLIIFDSCPVMGLADAPTLASLVDGTVFVLESNRLPFGQARSAVRRLALAGGKILGVVLTKYRALEAGQAYGYQYGYYEYGRDK